MRPEVNSNRFEMTFTWQFTWQFTWKFHCGNFPNINVTRITQFPLLGSVVYYMWQDIKMCKQLNVINNIVLSKCWGNKAVFHSVNLRSLRFFCWSLKKTLGRTFMWKCDFNFFQITLPPHSCLLGNFSFIFGGSS